MTFGDRLFHPVRHKLGTANPCFSPGSMAQQSKNHGGQMRSPTRPLALCWIRCPNSSKPPTFFNIHIGSLFRETVITHRGSSDCANGWSDAVSVSEARSAARHALPRSIGLSPTKRLARIRSIGHYHRGIWLVPKTHPRTVSRSRLPRWSDRSVSECRF